MFILEKPDPEIDSVLKQFLNCKKIVPAWGELWGKDLEEVIPENDLNVVVDSHYIVRGGELIAAIVKWQFQGITVAIVADQDAKVFSIFASGDD